MTPYDDIELRPRWLRYDSLPGGTKPLPKPMVTSHQQGPATFTWRQCHTRHQSSTEISLKITSLKFHSNLLGTDGLKNDEIFYGICCRADSRHAPRQWETSLQSNAVSHWLSANLESAIYCIYQMFSPVCSSLFIFFQCSFIWWRQSRLFLILGYDTTPLFGCLKPVTGRYIDIYGLFLCQW